MNIKKTIKVKYPEIRLIWMIVQQKYTQRKSPEAIKQYITKKYKQKVGGDINWINPKRYTEKIHVFKLQLNQAYYMRHTDKLTAKDHAQQVLGKAYTIKTLGVWNQASDIDFSSLPMRFVLKTNHACGNIFFVDKQKLTPKKQRQLCRRLDLWLKVNWCYGPKGYEMQYANIKPQIFAEEFIVDKNGKLYDYKFMCFNGKPVYIFVNEDRFGDFRRNFYDLHWNLQPWNQCSYGNTNHPLPKPENLDEMIAIATQLAQGTKQIRIDLYNVDGHIYFGEYTFTNGNGYEPLSSEDIDYQIGALWQL